MRRHQRHDRTGGGLGTLIKASVPSAHTRRIPLYNTSRTPLPLYHALPAATAPGAASRTRALPHRSCAAARLHSPHTPPTPTPTPPHPTLARSASSHSASPTSSLRPSATAARAGSFPTSTDVMARSPGNWAGSRGDSGLSSARWKRAAQRPEHGLAACPLHSWLGHRRQGGLPRHRPPVEALS